MDDAFAIGIDNGVVDDVGSPNRLAGVETSGRVDYAATQLLAVKTPYLVLTTCVRMHEDPERGRYT